eukprot:3068961-Pyramimonas_sp.AAC.1
MVWQRLVVNTDLKALVPSGPAPSDAKLSLLSVLEADLLYAPTPGTYNHTKCTRAGTCDDPLLMLSLTNVMMHRHVMSEIALLKGCIPPIAEHSVLCTPCQIMTSANWCEDVQYSLTAGPRRRYQSFPFCAGRGATYAERTDTRATRGPLAPFAIQHRDPEYPCHANDCLLLPQGSGLFQGNGQAKEHGRRK